MLDLGGDVVIAASIRQVDDNVAAMSYHIQQPIEPFDESLVNSQGTEATQ